MFRKRLAWFVSVVTTAMLAVMLLSVGGASAGAQTRLLYVGDPTQVSNPPNPYQISPTLVSPGQITYFDVLIKNQGKQTLTGATVGMGASIATGDGTNYGLALPSGWTIEDIADVSGISPVCTTTGSLPGATGLSCNFGNLARNAGGTIRIFLTAGSALPGGSASIQVSGKVAENVGGNVGSNSNTFFAVGQGDFFVSGPGVVAGLFNNGKITPSTHNTGAGTDITSIDLSNLATDAYLVSIDEVSGGPACPSTITTCSNAASTAHVNNGQTFNTYFVWTIQFAVDSTFKLTNKTGFIHFFDDYDSTSNPTAYETFFNVTQTSCQRTHPKVPCADFSLVTVGSDTFLQIVFETNRNGSGKYF